MSEDPTLPPVNTPRRALACLWAWGWQHTVVSAGAIGLVVGYILGKW